MQPQPQRVSPEDAKAMLGLTTHLGHLSQGTMPQPNPAPTATQPAPGTQEQGQQQEPFDNTKNEATMADLGAKMETIKAEMETMMHKEVSSIKDLIIQSLQDDEQKD